MTKDTSVSDFIIGMVQKTKQEEIREGINHVLHHAITDTITRQYFVGEVINELVKQGVAIKVDRELPWLEANDDNDDLSFAHYMAGWNNGLNRAKRAGYVAVESLL